MKEYLKELCNKLKTLTQIGVLIKYKNKQVDDIGDARTGYFYIAGRAQKGYILSPYGLCSNPPLGSSGVAINVNGGGSYPTGIVDYPSQRFKDLEEGEVAIGNYNTGSYIKFDKDGNIRVYTTGKVYVDGSVVGKTDIDPVTMPNGILVNGVTIDETHEHTGVQTGAGKTGGVV